MRVDKPQHCFPRVSAHLCKFPVKYRERIEILVGSGVNAQAIRRIRAETHAVSFHMSGKCRVDSRMRYRNEQVSMGLPGLSEFEMFCTDGDEIRAARTALDRA